MELPALHGMDLDRTLHDAPGDVLLVLTAPGCGACRAVKAALRGVPAPEGLRAFEVDAGSAPALLDELGVFHLPALWVFRGGEPLAEVSAEPTRLAAAIAAARR